MDTAILLVLVFVISAILTVIFKEIFSRGYGNLYTNVRGGTPRAVGLAPFIALLLFFPSPGKYLIVIMGIFAFLDDLIGRRRIIRLKIEVGQLSRGIGMLLVMALGFYYFGPASILIALMIQPLNIADMQPGTACSTIIFMCILVILAMISVGSIYYVSVLIILFACIGYAPLDYKGRVMMGEIGNHSFAVGLGISYAILGGYLGSITSFDVLGGFLVALVLLILTAILVAFLRKGNLKEFMHENLEIHDPYFGDYLMDVLTGGGLGDLIRRVFLGNRKIIIKKKLFKFLGFRRLVFNPYAI